MVFKKLIFLMPMEFLEIETSKSPYQRNKRKTTQSIQSWTTRKSSKEYAIQFPSIMSLCNNCFRLVDGKETFFYIQLFRILLFTILQTKLKNRSLSTFENERKKQHFIKLHPKKSIKIFTPYQTLEIHTTSKLSIFVEARSWTLAKELFCV